MDEAIRSFWKHFLDHLCDFEALRSAADPAYDKLLGMLQQVDEGLYIQFCSTPGCNELIITAEGESGLFPLVERIVHLAPHVDDWTIFALKPKVGFPEFIRWEDVTVEIGKVIARPCFHPENGEGGLRLFAPGVTRITKEKIHLALLQALDSGLGERKFASTIQFTDVYPLEDLPEGGTSFPLHRLEEYLDWRQDEIDGNRKAGVSPEGT